MTAERKRRAWTFGRLAESLCAWHLRARGYRILARRFRTPVGEIDIVARRGNTLAVVEVKARADQTTAMDSLRPRQRGRIQRAAEIFIAARPPLAGMDVRFDIMVVAPWRPPDHIMDAWRP